MGALTKESIDRQSDDRVEGLRGMAEGRAIEAEAIVNKCEDREASVNLYISIRGKKGYI